MSEGNPGELPIDVVVPVYNAVRDVDRCVESVLACTTPPYRLVLIDDASPDPQVARYFATLAARRIPHVLLLRNDTNLGFTGTANRGMQLSRAHVVLLNSDTRVTHGWLDAIRRCAGSNASFGTITPFSNNAEICSFPRFCEDNPWPEGEDPEVVRAAMERAAAPTYPDLPTGVGFCMFVSRLLIDAIGVFDPAFGLGYGEENDFCLRGFDVGYRNVLCEDAFVLHLGARSFEGRKADLGVRNMRVLLERHPHYERMVQEYIAADPLRPIRDAALSQIRAYDPSRRGILHVIHGHGGGTEHHARALIDSSRRRYRHYLVTAVAERWQLEEHLDDGDVRRYELARTPGEPWAAFLRGICATFRIELLHLHNISGCRDGLLEAVAGLGLPYGYTVHDVTFGCPTITFLAPDGMYCGGETDPARCRACLAAQPQFERIDIVDWRAASAKLLSGAAFVVAPSRWAADQLARYFPSVQPTVIAHGAPGVWASGESSSASTRMRLAVLPPRDDVPTVAVLGAIGPDKGARRLERMVALARERGAKLRFVLIGYLDREHGPWQSNDARWIIHGPYHAPDLPDLLEHYRVNMVVYPSAGPETFSFTLSESWAAGLPVLVPPIGALAERVRESGAGWLWSDEEWRSEARMLDVLLARLHDQRALAAAAVRARQVPQPSLAAMAQRTVALYDGAIATPEALRDMAPLAPARIRDALGYRLWYPPVTPLAGADTAVRSDTGEAKTVDADLRAHHGIDAEIGADPSRPEIALNPPGGRASTRLRRKSVGRRLRAMAIAALRSRPR